MEMDAVHGARRRFDAPAGTLHDLASPLFPRTLRRHCRVDGERVIWEHGRPRPHLSGRISIALNQDLASSSGLSRRPRVVGHGAKINEVAGTSPATTAVEVLRPDRSRPQNDKERAGRPRSWTLSINPRSSAGVTGYWVIRAP